jgi:hypothetical protein
MMQHDLNPTRPLHFVAVSRRSGNENKHQIIEFELADADAKSHAARVGHQRKNNASRLRMAYLNRTSQPLTDPRQTTGYLSSCLLDPFVTLMAELSITERNLVHECEFDASWEGAELT